MSDDAVRSLAWKIHEHVFDGQNVRNLELMHRMWVGADYIRGLCYGWEHPSKLDMRMSSGVVVVDEDGSYVDECPWYWPSGPEEFLTEPDTLRSAGVLAVFHDRVLSNALDADQRPAQSILRYPNVPSRWQAVGELDCVYRVIDWMQTEYRGNLASVLCVRRHMQFLFEPTIPTPAQPAKTPAGLERSNVRTTREANAVTPDPAIKGAVKAQRSALDALEDLVRRAPELDRGGEDWLSAKEAATRENVAVRTLSDYRKRGFQTTDGMAGCDCYKRVWRRHGTARSRPFYWKKTLRNRG